MSIDYSAHIGPYIKVYNPKKASTTELTLCCNKNCSQHNKEVDSKFCPECGSLIKTSKLPCRESIDFNVYDEFNERLHEMCPEEKPHKCDDYLYFAANDSKKFGVNIDPTYCNEVKISTESGEEFMEFFDVYQKEIDRLKEIFGKDNVQIKYGVVTWAS